MKNHIKKVMYRIGSFLVDKSKYNHMKDEAVECYNQGAPKAIWDKNFNGLACPYAIPKSIHMCPGQGTVPKGTKMHRCLVDITFFEDTNKVVLDSRQYGRRKTDRINIHAERGYNRVHERRNYTH